MLSEQNRQHPNLVEGKRISNTLGSDECNREQSNTVPEGVRQDGGEESRAAS
jgi:hypothetical protein